MMITGLPNLPHASAYFWKRARRATYDSWPFDDSAQCNAERMAAAGFYVIGDNNEPDLVECFICGKQLNGWERDDDPWSEHEKHQSDCPFVRLNKQDEKDWTVGDLYELYRKYQTKVYMDEVKIDIALLKDEAEQLMSELSIYRISQLKKSTG